MIDQIDVSGSDASGGNASPIVPDVSGQFEDIPISGETLQQEVVTYSGNTEVVTILQDCQYILVAILIGVGLLVGMLFALGFPSSRK
ncbi:MAG: hypothetical protein EGR90_07075 [Lachnospiraceae bacterium]|nr:hypothetical protein [Lachnospiraceae bacterium]